MAELTDSLPRRLRERASAHPDAVGWLQKRHGVWHPWTWAQADARVEELSAGLLARGLQAGEPVAVISGARVEAVLAVLACQRAGLVPVLLSPNLPPGAMATLAQQAGAVALIAEDQEQVDKVADIQSRMEQLRALWVIDPKGTRAYTHVRAAPLEDLRGHPGDGSVVVTVTGATPALMLFSAGVFSEPRCVAVSHGTLLAQQAGASALELREGERTASLFGLSDPLGYYFAVVAPVLSGTVACFGEDRLPSVPELRQCAPHVVAIPARLMDRLRRENAARASRCGGLRRALIQRWVNSSEPTGWLRALVGRPVANALGLGACRLVATGYERMAPVSARFLARLGIRALGLYGLAEAAGPVGVFPQAQDGRLRLVEPWRAQVAPAQDGAAGGQGSSQGRLRIDMRGQLVDTGDLVTLASGALHLVGRAADLLMLPDGTAMAPSLIEAELMASPYINQAVAVGGPASGIIALVELDEVTLRDWARQHALAFTTLRSLAHSTEVRALIDQAVAEANQRLPQPARIVRAVLLPRALEAANGELTASLALRRALIRNRYAHRLVSSGEQTS